MIIMGTEEKLFKILAEYGRIHEKDIVQLYSTYHYARKRIKQMIDHKYLKAVHAITGYSEAKKSKKLKYKLVQLTAKGRRTIEDTGIIFSAPVTTRIVSMEKQRKQTKTAVILDKLGIEILESNYNNYQDKTDMKWFEQSTVVKQHSKALDNHSRIMGILYSPGGDYAVYNIGNGTGKWYVSEEGTITGVTRYEREINKMIIMVKGSKMEDAIKAQEAFEENIYREIDKRTRNRTFVLPSGINMCAILSDDEKGYEMLENMTYKDWKLKIAQYCLGASEVKAPKVRSADFCYKEWNVYIMVHNDLDARENIKNYQFLMASSSKAGRDVIIICLDTDEEYYKNLFTIYTEKGKEVTVEIISISREEVKEVCRAAQIQKEIENKQYLSR